MKKALFILIGLVVISLFVWQKLTSPASEEKNSISTTYSQEDIIESSESLVTQRSIFVPYWAIDSGLANNEYDQEYYFGITFDENGDLSQDEGLGRLEIYKNNSTSKNSYLVIRLIDSEVNKEILEDEKIQKKVISTSIDQMIEYSFNGILLDLEMSGLGFESTEKSITSFIQGFSQELIKQNGRFYVALYGDTYYRARPYNVREIARLADKIIVMTYDFHKARGTHGPNFPFDKGRQYPYDYKTMIEDFKKDVDSGKLEIAFGMFGYDWGAGDQEMATSYSYNKIKQDFLTSCPKDKCKIEIGQETKEGYIAYEENNIDHNVWFESPESVAVKIKYAQDQGIGNFTYWAYSYF